MALASAPPAAMGEDGGAAELAALVRGCAETGAVREVAWLRFSALPAGLDRPHHRRLLREAASPRRGRPGRVFHLPNGDLAVVAPPSAAGAAQEATGALEGALDAETLARVLRPLRLPDEAAAVLAAIEDSLGLGECLPPAAAPAPPLDTAALAAAERALVGADVWPLHARRAVRRLPRGGGPPEFLREEVRPIPTAVADRLLGGRDPDRAPALAARLRDALAARLLSTLARAEWRAAPRPLHLALSPEAVTGEAFLRLDAALPASLRAMLTLGLPAAAILEAPDRFRFARDFARLRGYRLCLEAPSGRALALLPPERLELEAVRVPFAAGLPADPGPLPALAREGAVEVVLAGADSAGAIAWGWENGIECFQGRAADRPRG